MRSPYADRLSTGPLPPQPWRGVDPGTLMLSERGPLGLCTVVQVKRPSARVIRIAERGFGRAPEPRFMTLDVRYDGVRLNVDAGWWDVEGRKLC